MTCGIAQRPATNSSGSGQGRRPAWPAIAVATLILIGSSSAVADDRTDLYRFSLSPTYSFTEDHQWVGIGTVDYERNPQLDYQTSYIEPGAIWRFARAREVWFMMRAAYTDYTTQSDVTEYRPTLGFKYHFTRSNRWTFYNFARIEYRIQDHEHAGTSEYFRVRDRVGTLFSLTEKANSAGAVYGVADIEGFYRFDKDLADQLQVRAGLGWVISGRVRAELLYTADFTRSAGASLELTENIWRLNFKLARQHGLLERLEHGGLY